MAKDFVALVHAGGQVIKGGNDLFGIGKSTLDAVKNLYTVTQHVRFHMFLRACKAELERQGRLSTDSELELITWFESQFGREHAYEFIRRAIEAGSEITRAAMGRLYVQCATKPIQGVTTDELATLRAYETLDDASARLILYLEKSFPVGSQTPDNIRWPHGVLEVPRDEANRRKKDLLERFGVDTEDDLEDRLDEFGRLSMYRVSRGFSSSGSVSIVRNKRTAAFLDNLRWAVQLVEPTSDLV